jgi:NAD(P)-dependent dehydrogenase (short-subunit alcohol dehydrogenase family)
MRMLEGKVAIITGGTSGIGERTAEVFVREGATVVVAARRQQEGSALEHRLGVSFVRADVSNEADVKAMVDFAAQRFGRVDCLINNAGINAPMIGIADIDVAAFDQVMAVNVRGVFLGIKYVAPVMTAQGSGSIVNIASIGAHRAGMSSHSYTASKAAVLAMTRSAAAELGEKGIRVNSISPGGTVTGLFSKAAGVPEAHAEKVTDAVREVFATMQPLPRAGETEDIARAVAWLASDESGFVNGADLPVDGGWLSVRYRWSEGLAIKSDMTDRIKAVATSL